MICVESHFRLNRILLLAIGLWPYQKSKFVQFQVILLFGTLISFIIFQLTTFMTAECTLELIINVLSMALSFCTCVIEYISFWINPHKIKGLLEQLQHICNELKDENEIAIIRKYGNDAKRYTAIILAIVGCCVFPAILLQIWPLILDIILHTNESLRHHTMQIMTEHFVDREKYLYLILLHTNASICIGATTMTATGTMFISCIKHACGMFRIASYRIEHAMTINMLENINLEKQNMIYRKLIYAVDIHRKAMRYTEFFLSIFERPCFFLIIIAVLCLSLNFFIVFRNAALGNREEFLLPLVSVIMILSYMFLGNYIGQELMDHNIYVHSTAYNIRWYIAPVRAQKMILFILQRGSKAFNLNIGGMIVASLECFATLTNLSLSYFTVMYSAQK